MPNTIQHFAVNADDVDRARRFYESVFGWSFSAWGPPEFYQIDTGGRGDSSIAGALHKRRDVVPGKPIHGFECTIAVDNVDVIAETVKEAGGRVVMEKSVIEGVGELIFFEDTEGNIAAAMRYYE
jgi:hypothetical protein